MIVKDSAEPTAAVRPIALCEPHLGGNEWLYVKECLDTGWVSSVGSFVDRFEHMIAGFVDAERAVATVNGTAALHVALQLAGVGRDDEVAVSTLTFIAPANTVRYLGAHPVFIDAEPEYWQMDPQRLADFLDTGCRWRGGALRNNVTGRRVVAVLPVHVLGHPCDMDPILEIASKYELKVVEDATESLGARYRNRMLGQLGDAGCFSFNGNKVMTTGGGGMIITRDPAWAARAKYLTTQAKDPGAEYVHREVGYNFRLTNIQAAMGCAQMEQLDRFIARKRSIATKYNAAFQGNGHIVPMREAEWAWSIFWMYTVLLPSVAERRSLHHWLAARGIETRPLWQPLHVSQAHQGSQVFGGGVAERLYERALSLPCSVGLTDDDHDRVLNEIHAWSRTDI